MSTTNSATTKKIEETNPQDLSTSILNEMEEEHSNLHRSASLSVNQSSASTTQENSLKRKAATQHQYYKFAKECKQYMNTPKSTSCPYCGKIYKDKHIMKSHILRIHKIIPNKCLKCGKSFVEVKCLKVHIEKEHLRIDHQKNTLLHLSFKKKKAEGLSFNKRISLQVEQEEQIQKQIKSNKEQSSNMENIRAYFQNLKQDPETKPSSSSKPRPQTQLQKIRQQQLKNQKLLSQQKQQQLKQINTQQKQIQNNKETQQQQQQQQQQKEPETTNNQQTQQSKDKKISTPQPQPQVQEAENAQAKPQAQPQTQPQPLEQAKIQSQPHSQIFLGRQYQQNPFMLSEQQKQFMACQQNMKMMQNGQFFYNQMFQQSQSGSPNISAVTSPFMSPCASPIFSYAFLPYKQEMMGLNMNSYRGGNPGCFNLDRFSLYKREQLRQQQQNLSKINL